MDLRFGGLQLAPERAGRDWPPQHFLAAAAGRPAARSAPRTTRLAAAIRPLSIAITMGALAVVGYSASGLAPMPDSYREISYAVLVGSLGLLMVAALFWQRRAVAELRAREEQLTAQSGLLQSTLENMGEGLSVFDREGRLIAWNSRFVELLDMPRRSRPARPCATSCSADPRGDFGAGRRPEPKLPSASSASIAKCRP